MWASIVAWFQKIIGGMVVKSIFTKISDYIKVLIQDSKDKKEVAETVKNDMQKTKELGENPTRQEQIDAANDAFRNL